MKRLFLLIVLSIVSTDVSAKNASMPSRVKYGGECTLVLNGAKQDCGPEIVVSHVNQDGRVLNTFLTAFFPAGEREVTLISVGGFDVKRGPVEVGYDTSYEVTLSSTHVYRSKDQPNVVDAKGYCNTKRGNDLILIHCAFSVNGLAYEYTFRGENTRDDRPLLSAD